MGTNCFHDNTHDIRAVSPDRKCTVSDKTERVIPLLFDLSYGQIEAISRKSRLLHSKKDTTKKKLIMPFSKFVSVYISKTLISTYDYTVSELCTSSVFRNLDMLPLYLLK